MNIPPDVLLLLIFVIVVVFVVIVRQKRIVSSQSRPFRVRIQNPENAEAVYTETLRRFPNNWQASFNRARIRCQHGNGDGALEDVNRAIELKPRFPGAYNLRGDIYYARSELEQARLNYQHALSLRPKPLQKEYACLRLGYLKSDDFNRSHSTDSSVRSRLLDEAIAYFEIALSAKSNDVAEAALSGKAHIFYLRGDFQTALALFDNKLRHSPNSTFLLANRSLIYIGQGNLDAAITDCDRAIHLNDKLDFAYNSRAYAYALRGDYGQALQDCSHALELNPRYASAFGSRGIVYYLMGSFEDALVNFQQALDIDADHFESRAGKAIALYRLDRMEEAKTVWGALLDLNRAYADANKLKREYSCPDAFVEDARKVAALLND